MTDLQLLYAKERLEGRRHHAALRAIAKATGIDPETIGRCLRRADREDTRGRKGKTDEVARDIAATKAVTLEEAAESVAKAVDGLTSPGPGAGVLLNPTNLSEGDPGRWSNT